MNNQTKELLQIRAIVLVDKIEHSEHLTQLTKNTTIEDVTYVIRVIKSIVPLYVFSYGVLGGENNYKQLIPDMEYNRIIDTANFIYGDKIVSSYLDVNARLENYRLKGHELEHLQSWRGKLESDMLKPYYNTE